ncbi:hypothetical protein FVE85_0153 [Porphyridium purpureum]|uniref:F-box domain-containing protein n=1 Tax=Porphyridium purpureum TaxID=35688 RepID=A0A5J4Z0B3_PORPP|nr:hypothetical protein FVE85_0153 [Porphyridium purpureum]|eukprot:POR8776..scf208_2
MRVECSMQLRASPWDKTQQGRAGTGAGREAVGWAAVSPTVQEAARLGVGTGEVLSAPQEVVHEREEAATLPSMDEQDDQPVPMRDVETPAAAAAEPAAAASRGLRLDDERNDSVVMDVDAASGQHSMSSSLDDAQAPRRSVTWASQHAVPRSARAPESSAADDSVEKLAGELQNLLDYVKSKPSFTHASASFIRDHLRTLLVLSAAGAQRVYEQQEKERLESMLASSSLVPGSLVPRLMRSSSSNQGWFQMLPNDLARLIFCFLDGPDLAHVRLVCKQWDAFGKEEHLWQRLCTRNWRALDHDHSLWKLLGSSALLDDPQRWRKIYAKVRARKHFRCRLQKTGRFICHLVAHHVKGGELGKNGLPETLIVERRFSISHLETFVLPDASVLYFEPETDADRPGFEEFIEYLLKRERAGLALDDERRIIFIPPCEFSKQMGYDGPNLLGIVQFQYPPLANHHS